MRKRLWQALFGGLVVLVLMPSAASGARNSDGRIVFLTNRYCGARQDDCGRSEIATVRSDGSGVKVVNDQPDW